MRYGVTGCTDNPHRSGRPQKRTEINRRFLCQLSKKEPFYVSQETTEAVFDYTVEKEIINFTNAEGRRVYGDIWKDMEISLFQAYVGILLLASVF